MLPDLIAPIAYATGVNLNSVAETLLESKIPNGARKWMPLFVVVTNASANLSGGLLQFGLFTETGEGGDAILANGVNSATSLTAAGVAIKLDANVTTTDSSLYFHVDVANGSAATADVYVYGLVFPE